MAPKLFEAFAGYEDPGSAGGSLGPDVLGGPAILSGPTASRGANDYAFKERTEEQFEPILDELEKAAEHDPSFQKKVREAFKSDANLGELKQRIQEAKALVRESRRAQTLGAPGDSGSERAVELLGIEEPVSAGVPDLLGAVPDTFSDDYVRDHVDARYVTGRPRVDLLPNLRRYEDDSPGGLIGWLLFNGPEALRVPRRLTPPFREQFGRIENAAKFRRHSAADPFVYELREPGGDTPTRIALFADFGTGLGHTMFIARQLEIDRFEAAVHLGDVYYTGTPEQYKTNFKEPLEPVVAAGTDLFVIPDNHDGYSGFHAYCDFIDTVGNRTRQGGSYFALLTKHVQFIGVDTIWHSDRGRLQDEDVQRWLQERLAIGREGGHANVLLTGHEPYAYESPGLTALNEDVTALAGGAIDLWFWGNTHYCALFDRTDATPYHGSCIGHAGYPYKRAALGKPTAAPVVFLETGSRYEGSGTREDRGMNGFCAFEIDADGNVALRYLDWRGQERHLARFAKQPNGTLRKV